MKLKTSILVGAILVAIIIFSISTYMQKQLMDYEATISCLILTEDINANELVFEDKFKMAEIPISIVANQRVIRNFKEIENLYAKDNIKKSQIAIRSQFDTKENLSIYEVENGKEKISIKVKTAENGMSFQIKEKSFVNIYATLRNDFAINFLLDKERLTMGNEFEGYTVIKLLENIEVLGTFTIDGITIEEADGENLDSILIAVTPEEAKEINLLREFATFNITGVNDVNLLTNQQIASGDINL